MTFKLNLNLHFSLIGMHSASLVFKTIIQVKLRIVLQTDFICLLRTHVVLLSFSLNNCMNVRHLSSLLSQVSFFFCLGHLIKLQSYALRSLSTRTHFCSHRTTFPKTQGNLDISSSSLYNSQRWQGGNRQSVEE